MTASKYSLEPTITQRLRKCFPYTSFTLAIINAVSAASASKGLLSFLVPQRDPSPNQTELCIDVSRSHATVGASELKRYMAEGGWGSVAKAYVCEPRTAKEMNERYREVIALRALFADIARQNADRGRRHRREIVYSMPPSIGLLSSLNLLHHTASLEAKGLLKKMMEEGQLDRIKRCAYEKCGRFFWAQRVDRPCCQESCRNAYRQKRHREREKVKPVAERA